MEDFVHLNVHTHYSIYGGLSRVQELVVKAINCGMRGMAITDYGNMFSIKEFHEYVRFMNRIHKDEGLEPFKPIFGCELFVARLKEQRSHFLEDFGFHLTVLAKNLQGYRNLVKIVSNANVDGWWITKPRADRVDLEKYHEGLIVLSGDLAGEVPFRISDNDEKRAREAIEWYHNLFGDDYYLELQRHEVKDPSIRANRKTIVKQNQVNNVLVRLAKEYGIKLVATNDVSFTNEEDAEKHDYKICVDIQRNYEDNDRIFYTKQEWLKSREEMNEVFHDIPEALSNTVEILDKVEFYSIDHDEVVPPFPFPKECGSKEAYLDKLVYAGATRIYGETPPRKVVNRLGYEMDVIKQKGFTDYLLIIQDIVNHARHEMDTMVGPGRGPVSGSLVAYCLGITTIDPLKYGLLFERFMSPDCNRLPNIGVDIDVDGFERLYDWVVDRFGKDNCARLISFLKFRNLRKAPQKYARALKGINKEWDIMPRFFFISKGPVSNWVPVMMFMRKDDTAVLCTQYEDLCSTGLVEMDFMGQRILSVIKTACENIKQTHGYSIDLDAIPIDDKKTFELLQQGDTEYVYLFHLKAMQQYLRELHPTTLEHLSALYALSWESRFVSKRKLRHFIARKNGKEKIEYTLPCMESYLNETYGIGVYQEQMMLMSQHIAGFTKAESEELRKALNKRDSFKSHQFEQLFYERGKKNGYNANDLQTIWTQWYEVFGYNFNKAQAVSYALLAYQSAYLKANYREEYEKAITHVKMKRSDFSL